MITFKNVGRMGRTANAMFSVAGTIGVARKSGQEFAFPRFINHDARDRFNTSEDINLYMYFQNQLPELLDESGFNDWPYAWGYYDINLPYGNWNMNSHFQSERYFSHCIDEVRHYFTFKDEYQPSDNVAIHWRAGDYSGDDDAYHPRQRFDYYEKAVQHFDSNAKFCLFSDEPNEAYKLLKPLGVNLSIWDNGYIEDFKRMKVCHSFIIANSSYSLMASILANQPGKKIIAPSRWFGPSVGLDTSALYPENSIII